MIHPATELRLISPELGYGVFATERIARGTLVWVLDDLDQIISAERRMELDPELCKLLDRYACRDDEGFSILRWDNARYMNHSCECNCVGSSVGYFEIAVRDIEVGEEVTDDYRHLGLDDGSPCRCGSRECGGVVRMADANHHAPRWRRLLEGASAQFFSVPQPLMPWLRDVGVFDRYRPGGRSATRRHAG